MITLLIIVLALWIVVQAAATVVRTLGESDTKLDRIAEIVHIVSMMIYVPVAIVWIALTIWGWIT